MTSSTNFLKFVTSLEKFEDGVKDKHDERTLEGFAIGIG